MSPDPCDAAVATPPRPAWRATPAEEERMAAHLAEVARVRFSGDGPDHAVIRGAFPGKVLQLGVLPALPQPSADDPLTPEQLAQRIGQAPSTMGLDFRLRLHNGEGALDVRSRFAFYVQRYPDRDEQAAFYSDEDPAGRENDETDAGADPQQTPSADGGGGGAKAARHDADKTMVLMPKFERFDIDIGEQVAVSGSRGSVTVDLSAAVAAQLHGALTAPETVYPFLARRGQTLPVSALGDTAGPAADVAFKAAIAAAEGDARATPHTGPTVELTVAWQPDADDTVRVQVTLGNTTLAPQLAGRGGRSRAQQGGPRLIPRELALFNTRMSVQPTIGEPVALRFHEAPEDFRYADTRHTWALGRGCVGRRDGDDGPLATDTWPVYRQPRVRQNTGTDGELLLRFAELADERTMMGALGRVIAGMKLFDGEWQAHLDAWAGDAGSRHACADARALWRAEIAAFERGVDCLAADRELRTAFVAANEVFARIGAAAGYDSWRLFQACFIVVQLSALRARRVEDPQLRAELDICDVLWASTGAGKTEGYLGLIVTALFYDRLRGKQRGATALLRYPLRMLSVQQLQRVAVAVVAAEQHRQELAAAGQPLHGDPFEMGYWAGFSNTPNQLSDDFNDGETTIEWWQRTATTNDKALQARRIISGCPRLDCDGELALRPDVKAVRLRSVCQACGHEAPIHMTDEEVYRACPSVIVCTVDKLARVAWADEFVGLLAGPAYECPAHGYFNWHRGGRERDAAGAPKSKDRCAVGGRCARKATEYRTVPGTVDPAPALICQDELHLLEEELGTFDSHYETLMDTLWEELGDGLRPKMLAATATIEGGEAQVANLYARHIREFPSQGYDRHTSFYHRTDPYACQRLYVGALPNRPDVMEFGAVAQATFAQEVWRLQDDPDAAVAQLGFSGRDGAWMTELLARYELTLGYINRKENAGRIAAVLRALRHRGALPFEYNFETLVAGSAGESTLADIAAVLDRIETQYADGTPDDARLRGLIATSLISHGVDLDRLNVQVMNRMTPTVAGYVQSSSRAGRRHTGLVLVGFDRRMPRERSFFGHFLDYHAYIDRLIAPVPVNRFARFAPKATMPGILCGLVVHLLSRRRLDAAGRNPARPMNSLAKRFELRPWWTGPDGAGAADRLRALAMRSLGIGAKRVRRNPDGTLNTPEGLFAPVVEQWLQEAAEREFDRQVGKLEDFHSRMSLPMKLDPLRSFRSVDEPIEFRCLAAATDVQGDLTDPTRRRRRRPAGGASTTTEESN